MTMFINECCNEIEMDINKLLIQKNKQTNRN